MDEKAEVKKIEVDSRTEIPLELLKLLFKTRKKKNKTV